MEDKTYNLIIIGSGPAGFTASIYASRYKLTNLVLGEKIGGTIGLASKVCNYPGFESISGLELMASIEKQVKSFGVEVIYNPAVGTKRTEKAFTVLTKSGKSFQAKALILATGMERRQLNVPGEKEYLGKGVSYCTACDAPLYKDKVVAIIGGADGAVSGAVHLADFAKKVFVIYRQDKFRAEPVWVEQALKDPKIEPIYNTNIIKILGTSSKVDGVELDNSYQGEKVLPLDGVFVEIGGVPGVGVAASMGVELTEAGFIKVNEKMETNLQGVFSAGDCNDRLPNFQQLITACAEGALAAASAYKFLKKEQAPQILGIGSK
jgi:thioredoxin reductase (NADPH)